MSSDPAVLRREAAQCRRLLGADVVTEEGVKRVLREHEQKCETLAERIEAAGDKSRRKREIEAAYRADVARRRVIA